MLPMLLFSNVMPTKTSIGLTAWLTPAMSITVETVQQRECLIDLIGRIDCSNFTHNGLVGNPCGAASDTE